MQVKWYALAPFFTLRLSLLFLCLTFGFGVSWFFYLGSVIWDNHYDDFASDTYSAQYTYTETRTLVVSPTTVTFTLSGTETFVTHPSGSSAHYQITTGAYTDAETYTSGQPLDGFPTTFFSNPTLSLALATVVRQACGEGTSTCTGQAPVTQTLTPSPSLAGATTTPTTVTLPTSSIPANTYNGARKRAIAAFVFVCLLLLCSLAHVIASFVFNIRFLRLLDLPSMVWRPGRVGDAMQSTHDVDEQRQRICSELRRINIVYVVLTIGDFAFGLPSIVLLGIHKRAGIQYLKAEIVVWSVSMAMCIATIAALGYHIRHIEDAAAQQPSAAAAGEKSTTFVKGDHAVISPKV